MAYGLHYYYRFTNRRQKDTFRVEILEDGYDGPEIELTGGPDPFIYEWKSSDGDILNPIKALEASLSFYGDINSFYSENDNQFKVILYYESTVDLILFSGYVVQDDCSSDIRDTKKLVSLKATDNLGLLKDATLSDCAFSGGTPYGKLTLYEIVTAILALTNVTLPLNIYANIFENGMNDRGDNSTNEPFSQLRLFTGIWQNSDGTYRDCYSILSDILSSLNACIFQSNGFWNIIRVGEYAQFSGAIPGTKYPIGLSPTAVTLSHDVSIARASADFYPINADQVQSIERPLKYVKNTFQYNQPEQLIRNQDLLSPGSLISSSTSGGIKTDNYNIPSYWRHENSAPNHNTADGSYIVVKTDVNTGAEVERYVYTPFISNGYKWLVFNPIEVSAGDYFDFRLQFKTNTDSNDTYYFRVRFQIIRPDGSMDTLVATGSPQYLKWNTGYSAANYKVDLGMGLNVKKQSDYTLFQLSDFVEDTGTAKLPLIPAEGMLLISVNGANSPTGDNVNTYWNDISLTFTNKINDQLSITGQTHTNTQAATVKNKEDNDITIDDSPRNTIAGTLFLSDATNFAAGIGNIYFTKTALWHRGQANESKRLGDIITTEKMWLKNFVRTAIEGTFGNIKTSADLFINPLCLISWGAFTRKKFLFEILTVDVMNCQFNGKMIEVYSDDETNTGDYEFKYLYSTK